jgi:hypothetical protein
LLQVLHRLVRRRAARRPAAPLLRTAAPKLQHGCAPPRYIGRPAAQSSESAVLVALWCRWRRRRRCRRRCGATLDPMRRNRGCRWPIDVSRRAAARSAARSACTTCSAGRRAARRRTSRWSTWSKSVLRAGLAEGSQRLVSGPCGAVDQPRFMGRSFGIISVICQRTRGRHRRSARLTSGTGTGRQATHRSDTFRVVRLIRRVGC